MSEAEYPIQDFDELPGPVMAALVEFLDSFVVHGIKDGKYIVGAHIQNQVHGMIFESTGLVEEVTEVEYLDDDDDE